MTIVALPLSSLDGQQGVCQQVPWRHPELSQFREIQVFLRLPDSGRQLESSVRPMKTSSCGCSHWCGAWCDGMSAAIHAVCPNNARCSRPQPHNVAIDQSYHVTRCPVDQTQKCLLYRWLKRYFPASCSELASTNVHGA